MSRRFAALPPILCGSLAILFSSNTATGAPVRRIGYWNDVIASHRISGSNRVRVDSRKAAEAAFDGVDVEVEIDTSGEILRAHVDPRTNDSKADPAPALAAVRRWRFRPFEYDGAPVIAVGTVHIDYEGPGEWRRPGAPMPPIDYDNLSIILERSACYGPCPDYRVEIKGDGEVRFTTRAEPVNDVAAIHRAWNAPGVLVPGLHVSRIDRLALDGLISRFRDAHFFGLKDRYVAEVTDSPTFVLTFQTGGHRKQVVDYVGNMVAMPEAVTALEDEVDRVAGTARWVTGDKNSNADLASEGFDFSSPAAASLLLLAIPEAPEEMLLDLIARGVPLESELAGEGKPVGRMALEQSITFSRPALFEELARRGWLRRVPAADLSQAFARGGGGCNPVIAKGLVGAGADPAARGPAGETALIAALESYSCNLAEGRDAGPMASLLIGLGVPVNAADKNGETALYKAARLEIVKLLLAAGARVDIRNAKGLSPAFGNADDSIVLTLLEAGADPRGCSSGGLTLRQKARNDRMPGTLAWLDAHHIEQSAPSDCH